MAEETDESPCGRLTWIGLRPRKGDAPRAVDSATVVVGQGLEGDHFRGLPGGAGTRQVTLISASALLEAAHLLGHEHPIDPGLARRNLVLEGLDVAGLRNQRFRIGREVVLETTGGCPPCDKMEANLGPGGKLALSGLGGITARVTCGGRVQLGDAVEVLGTREDPGRA